MRSDKVKVISTNEIIFFTKSIYWKTRLVRMIFAFHSWISTSSVTLINCSGRGWRLWVELWLPFPDLPISRSPAKHSLLNASSAASDIFFMFWLSMSLILPPRMTNSVMSVIDGMLRQPSLSPACCNPPWWIFPPDLISVYLHTLQ